MTRRAPATKGSELAATPMQIAGAPRVKSVDDLTDGVLEELLAVRRRHGFWRAGAVPAMTLAAFAALGAGATVPAWGLLLLYGLPVAVLIGGDAALVRLWKRSARDLGVPGHVVEEVRARLRGLPPRWPPYRVDELRAIVRAG